MNEQRLTDITRGLQHAAQTTLGIVAEQFIRTLDQFFDPKEDGTLQAKTVRVQVGERRDKTEDGKERITQTYTMVPLIALVAPRGLALDKMRVNMSVRVERAESRDATSFDNSEATRTSFTVSMGPRGEEGERRKSDVFDVELEFKAWDPPEAVMRVIDLCTNTITPFSVTLGPGEKPPRTAYADTERYKAYIQSWQQRQARKERRAKEGGPF